MIAKFGWMCRAALSVVAVTMFSAGPVRAQEAGFPFGFEITLDAAPKPGSRKVPSLEIAENGTVRLELWCKAGKGQFSVAGNTVIFAAGPLEDRSCPPDRAQADDDLVAALSAAATWTRKGDQVSFVGPTTLRFLINSN